MNASDNTGLGLFDDTASAVGNFPTALRGYDRTAVDDYVRTLEDSVVKSRRHATQLEQQVTMLQDEMAIGWRQHRLQRRRLRQPRRARQRHSPAGSGASARAGAERDGRGREAQGAGATRGRRAAQRPRPERATPSRAAALHRLISYAASCAMRSKPRWTRPRPKRDVADRGCPAASRVGTPGGRQRGASDSPECLPRH